MAEWYVFARREIRCATEAGTISYIVAEVQWLAASALYFLKINNGELYKIGVTSSPIDK